MEPYRLEIRKTWRHRGPARPAKVLDVADDAADVFPRLDCLDQQPPNLGHLLRVIRRPRAQAAGHLERGVVQLVVRVGPDAGERGQQLRRDGRVRLDLSGGNFPCRIVKAARQSLGVKRVSREERTLRVNSAKGSRSKQSKR